MTAGRRVNLALCGLALVVSGLAPVYRLMVGPHVTRLFGCGFIGRPGPPCPGPRTSGFPVADVWLWVTTMVGVCGLLIGLYLLGLTQRERIAASAPRGS